MKWSQKFVTSASPDKFKKKLILSVELLTTWPHKFFLRKSMIIKLTSGRSASCFTH